ncbi:hypothetical protein Tcan_05552 [Toxocara canis]|uniref:Uncharacterized protein n=1 Tax=Toxocara canis TaxID=6265 RepID=A0A0B2USH9_TOXCA|nr:hypothetical protein Tcan_05552 [Toxocara canis]
MGEEALYLSSNIHASFQIYFRRSVGVRSQAIRALCAFCIFAFCEAYFDELVSARVHMLAHGFLDCCCAVDIALTAWRNTWAAHCTVRTYGELTALGSELCMPEPQQSAEGLTFRLLLDSTILTSEAIILDRSRKLSD